MSLSRRLSRNAFKIPAALGARGDALVRRPFGSRATSLPSSAFDQHYTGNANSGSDLSGRLLERFCGCIRTEADRSTSAYEMSMPMLTAGLLGPACWNVLGTRAVDAMHHTCADLLVAETESAKVSRTFNAWIRGRILLGCDTAGSQAYPTGHCAGMLAEQLRALPGEEHDQFSCWAFSYLMQSLARSGEGMAEYRNLHTQWMGSIDACLKEQAVPDCMWALACAIAAAAQAQDTGTYRDLKALLRGHPLQHPPAAGAPVPPQELSVLMQLLPVADYRAWAVSLVAVAAAQMHDADMLQGATAHEVQDALLSQSPDVRDRMLALSNFAFAEYLAASPPAPAEGEGTAGAGTAGGSRARAHGWRYSTPAAHAALMHM